MSNIWRIYRIKNCRYTSPRKLKFIVIVCKDVEHMGFLINTKISPYISNRPHMLECQIALSKSDYGFLFHDSYLDCATIYAFNDDELVVGLEMVNNKTKTEIKEVVSKAKMITKRHKKMILDN